MANNERVSQLVELPATDLQPDDVILATDTSKRESKKIEIGQLLLYFENSGSYLSYHALTSLTASYVAGSGVDGAVAVATNATQSVSSSWSAFAVSASNARSASFAAFAQTSYASTTIADTASFLNYSGFPNGSASYALRALLAEATATASYLAFFGGLVNGTASYALTSSLSTSSSFASQSFSSSYSQWADQSFSSSWATSSVTSIFSTSASYSSGSAFSTSSSFASQSLTASFIIGNLGYEPVKAWAFISWSCRDPLASTAAGTSSIVSSYNIASFTWLNRTTDITGVTYWDQFGVVFQTPLSNTSYMLIGTGDRPYGPSTPISLIMHPIYSQKTTSGFTMSIASETAITFYTTKSGAYPNNKLPIATFQILGF